MDKHYYDFGYFFGSKASGSILIAVDKELNEDDSELSSEVIIEFKKHKLVKNEYVKTVNDKILVFLAFAFDLNYDYSKQTILEKGYYDKMFEHIKNKDKFKPYFDEVKKYLKGE